MNPQAALERLRVAEVRRVPLDTLQTDEALQPRDLRMVPYREQERAQVRSEEHSGNMRLVLEASGSVELEPLLVAEIDGGLYVVDGHHRLRAYRLAQREAVPCRVAPMGHREAVMVSKLVNCSSRALEMHIGQKRDAAWQYLAEVTEQGSREVSTGESLRKIAARFGISKTTVDRMLHKLPKVNPAGYPAEKCDPGTGYPRWKTVCDWRASDDEELGDTPMNEDQWTRKEAERLARKLGMLETGTTAAAWKLALRMYADEAAAEARNEDTRQFLKAIAEPLGETPDF